MVLRQSRIRCAVLDMARILIVGDAGEVLELVGHLLKQEGYQVRILDGRKCHATRIKNLSPDLLILDPLSLNCDVTEICKELRKQRCFERLPILALRVTNENSTYECLHINGLIEQPIKRSLLIAQVKEQLDGEPEKVFEQICIDDLVIDPLSLGATRQGLPLALSALEFRLLYYLASHPNKVCRRDQLLKDVWDDPKTAPRAIDVVIRHLRMKIEACPEEPRWIRLVRGQGYSFRVSDVSAADGLPQNEEKPRLKSRRS